MKLIQSKYIISTLVVAAIATWRYAQYTNTDRENEGIKLGNNIIVSSESVETDTGKRLETVANSGNILTVSPFGSGKPLTEEPKPKFQKPNIEWKTRTINDITYRLGEGNPIGVALTAEEVEKIGKVCESHEAGKALYDAEFCNSETERLKYLTSEAEKHIIAALSDPNWEKLATECEKNFRTIETTETFQNATTNPNFPYFDRVFAPGFLDIENFISVEPTTGWKKLNTGRTIGLSQFIMGAMLNGYKNASGVQNPYGDCVDRYGKGIVEHFENATATYMWPVDGGSWSTSSWKYSTLSH